MQLAESLAVDLRIGDEYAFRHHRLVLFLPFYLDDRTYEGCNSFGVRLCAYYVELVANVEYGVAVRNADVSFVEETRAHEVAV